MGLFRREPTIGRSNLTKSDLERLLDLDSEYRTDYTYVSSKSYRPDGSVRYENPRMFRLPLDSFRRKRAFEKAWKTGYIHYFSLWLSDFMERLFANPAKVAGNIVGSVVYFIVQIFWTIASLLSLKIQEEHHDQQYNGYGSKVSRRHSFERERRFSWSSDEDARLGEIVRRRSSALHTPIFANENYIKSPTIYPQTISSKPSIGWRALRRIARLITYIVTIGFYPTDFGEESDRQQRSTYVQMFSECGFLNAPHTGSREDEKTPWIEDDDEAFSDDFPIRESTQISSAASPPTYEEPWDEESREREMASPITTPLGPSEMRHETGRMVARSSQPVVESTKGIFETVAIETLVFIFAVCMVPVTLVRSAIRFFSTRREVVYNLRSRSVRSGDGESAPIPFVERTIHQFSKAFTATMMTLVSIASSVLLAPVMVTTYLVSTALGKASTNPSPVAHVGTPSSKSDYMVGRACGIVAECLYAFVTALLSSFVFLFSLLVRMSRYIRENAPLFFANLISWSPSSQQRSVHAMTTRAMSRGTVMPAEGQQHSSRVHKRRYKRCLIWLIPLIALLLLAGLVGKRCYEDGDFDEKIELLQYPSVLLGRTYEAASSTSRSIWTKICRLVTATGRTAYALKERIIMAFASQRWTSQTKISSAIESSSRSAYDSVHSGFSYVRLCLMDLWNYVWSIAEKASLLPGYAVDAGTSLLNGVYEFGKALIDGFFIIIRSIWEILLPFFILMRNKVENITTRWSEAIQQSETVTPMSMSFDNDRSALELGLQELRREKSIMTEQLEQLRRERELDEERYRELRKAIEIAHISIEKPHLNEEMLKKSSAMNEELLAKKIETHIHNYITNLNLLDDVSINKRLSEMEARLLARLEQLSLRIEADFDAKIGGIKRESADAQNSLSNEISDLASAIANQRNEFDTFRRERDAKLAQLAHAVMLVETEQAEDIKRIKAEIDQFIKDEVAKGISERLMSVTKKSEEESAALRDEIHKQVESRVMTLFAREVAKTAVTPESRIHGHEAVAKEGDVMSRFTESDLLSIKELIAEALRLYDADKTGKVDYALESSGGSVISTRCTETYKEKSRLESIFGIPLWYSSYSPRTVIQHRTNALSSGECWAFHGVGYLTIKLALPIHVTEVSYEHLRRELHPDGVVRSAPRRFQIWAFKELNDLESKILLGEYEFDREGDSLQYFQVQRRPSAPTPILELVVLSNWGAEYTCLYRLRVHGQKPSNTTMEVTDDAPVVDHRVDDEFTRGTRPFE
uniref:SUN domain-containing protein n=3 Tax=Parascaris univalens TaxID=6257 RepID=A0A915CEC5_PARUN